MANLYEIGHLTLQVHRVRCFAECPNIKITRANKRGAFWQM